VINFDSIKSNLEGEFVHDSLIKKIYATDASSYRELPAAVAFPKSTEDIKKLIHFANENGISLIPRTAGTSLAGQVVGNGIVVDVSKHMTSTLEVNDEENWVRVQPGVIRDELNMHLNPFGMMFGPETSTSNRAMVGGMIGNNSCGSNSVVYGSTRDHLLEVKGILSDGSEVHFKAMSKEEFEVASQADTLEGKIYKQLGESLSSDEVKDRIEKEYPKKSIPRRNTGYAIDLMLPMVPFKDNGDPFNICKLIAGSEGTLMFITEAKLHAGPLPPKYDALICVHFESMYDSLKATQLALKYNPGSVELMDHFILECTKENIKQRANRFFVQGDPAALLVIELRRNSKEDLKSDCDRLIKELKEDGFGYHYPVITGKDISKVWNLRKAGLGVLSNLPGDAKPVPVVEDTAVAVADLPDFIKDFNVIMGNHGLECVHYAHAGSGELHLRPILDLKTEKGNALFRQVAEEISRLVKKYKGSFSGEHGDGRLRAEFIPFLVGEENYQLLREIKYTWDPDNIFNPGKIVDTPQMNTSLRYYPGQETRSFDTTLSFESTQGILRASELCNGSGDCRKTTLSGGIMCPSYMASHDEKDTTRARANVFREVVTRMEDGNPFASEEIKEVMDLCLSCKGCKSECPSNVDIAKIKAEFLHNYYKEKGVPLRAKMFARTERVNRMASKAPGLYNFFSAGPSGRLIKGLMGVAQERSLPKLAKYTLRKWIKRKDLKSGGKGKVAFFCDEFTNYLDVGVGEKAIGLLSGLGYDLEFPDHVESGRAAISKGLLDDARKFAEHNIHKLYRLVEEGIPLVGVEPSAILTFRDEYIDLLRGEAREKAKKLADNVFLIEEFLASELDSGGLTSHYFTSDSKKIKLHGHCHQKSLASMVPTKKLLSLPRNYEVQMIPSGCCGMAGSFGYEKEHYEMSMAVGELVLFPAVRKVTDEIVAAPGTSCRHQIKDGTGKHAFHPVEILFDALNPEV
jgi:FAD/FMN-containing dehydrogenase/Fe-S oxidoreductase